ncbi:hypothetical protein FHS16_004563 [Paenibacillus endophyticus]|uniref:XRE family transcriptional regulator n=1 Tax=Paenibacillus endophyticus TaxID=1294268 RepID=A0A7W5GC49_9BACL|nr:hypothetical protein [Paenibacillus endophyticus]MBB3154481.1 hypothetical protein [Paenibacillus endophyticus]
MNDNELRSALLSFQKRFGTPIIFIAKKCGVSREHLSKWINIESYLISNELKIKIKTVIKSEL